MRLLLEILIIGGLIYSGWEIPFKQRVDEWSGKAAAATATATPLPDTTESAVATPTLVPRLRQISRTTATPSGAWMWDRSHRSPLDPPSPSPQ